jgi:CRP-like cAMP-binding protein
MALRQLGALKTYTKGGVIGREGERSSRIEILRSGWGVLTINGKTVGLAGEGRVYTPSVRTIIPNVATLTAIGPMTTLSFERDALVALLVSSPEAMLGVADMCIARVLDFQLFLYHMSLPALEHRISEVLWAVSAPQPDGSRMVPSVITQQVLADLLQTSREDVNKKRKVLVSSGYLAKKGTSWFLSAETPSFSASSYNAGLA